LQNTFRTKLKIQPISFILIGVVLFLSSCSTLNSNKLLRTSADFKFDTFADSLQVTDYRIAPNDEIAFKIFTHNGEKMVELMSTSGGAGQQPTAGLTFLVEKDGMIKLPIIQRVKVSGMTIREAEQFLETEYTNYLNKPFVQLKVTNNRVIVFPGGDGGSAKVVMLENTNTTVFEALAMAGGITDGKAHNIKLIRGDLQNPKVYKIDLSTIEGVKNANLTLQANDIIYVEPRAKYAQRIMTEVAPYISILTTGLLIYGLFR
jgi:polysaccharide biosynthesis/export protein